MLHLRLQNSIHITLDKLEKICRRGLALSLSLSTGVYTLFPGFPDRVVVICYGLQCNVYMAMSLTDFIPRINGRPCEYSD